MGVTPREGSIPSSGTKQFNRLAAPPDAATRPLNLPTIIETAIESLFGPSAFFCAHLTLPHNLVVQKGHLNAETPNLHQLCPAPRSAINTDAPGRFAVGT